MINETDENEWDMVISPSPPWFDLRFKELWHYKDLLLIMVKRDFTAAYKQTIFGPLWHFLQPVLTTIVFVVVFNNIAKIPTDNVPAPLFYLCGLTLWNYFSACLTGTSNTFIANAGIFGKVYFPRLIIPLSVIVSNAFKLGIQLLLLLMIMAYYVVFKNYQIQLNITVLWIVPIIIVVAIFGLSSGILISSLTTKYRDMTVLVSFGIQLMMYATPVIYPISQIPAKYSHIIGLNPLTWLMEAFKAGLLGKGVIDLNMLSYSCGVTAFLFLISLVVFNRVERTFMDTV